MVDPVFVVSVVLLAAAVVGSVAPVIPAGLLSLAGLSVYALFGTESIPIFALASLIAVALVTVLVEGFAGPIAARATGASTGTAVAAAVGGLVLFLVTGPLGILVGMVGVVFLLELRRGVEPRVAARTSVFAVLGILASSAVQALLTASVLLAFLVVVLF